MAVYLVNIAQYAYTGRYGVCVQDAVLAISVDKWTLEEQRRTNALIDNRKQNMDRFKPGVQSLVLIFSDNFGEDVFWFPYFELLQKELKPILQEVRDNGD